MKECPDLGKQTVPILHSISKQQPLTPDLGKRNVQSNSTRSMQNSELGEHTVPSNSTSCLQNPDLGKQMMPSNFTRSSQVAMDPGIHTSPSLSSRFPLLCGVLSQDLAAPSQVSVPRTQAELAAEVKNRQRQGQQQQLWKSYLNTIDSTTLDPACHGADTLQKFIHSYSPSYMQPHVASSTNYKNKKLWLDDLADDQFAKQYELCVEDPRFRPSLVAIRCYSKCVIWEDNGISSSSPSTSTESELGYFCNFVQHGRLSANASKDMQPVV